MAPLVVVAGLIIAIVGAAIPDEQKFNDAVKKAVKKIAGSEPTTKPAIEGKAESKTEAKT